MKHYTNTSNPIDFPKSKDEIDNFIDGYADRIENMSDDEWENLGKSMLKRVKGNLIDMALKGDFEVIVQGCNCHNTMGSGIAKEIRERLPEAWQADQDTPKGDYNKLGNYSVAYLEDLTVVNAYTQFNTAKFAGEDVFEYAAFELILQKLLNAYPNCSFGFPYIGMGLAGGNKDIIIGMLEQFAQDIEKFGGSATLVEFG